MTRRSPCRRVGVALLVGVVAGAMLLLGCELSGRRRPRPANLEFDVQPEDARVFIDDEFVSSARVLNARGFQLSAGEHQITIEAAGYFPHDLDVELPPGGPTRLRVHLRAVPP